MKFPEVENDGVFFLENFFWKTLRGLDRYSLLTVLSTLALQFQFTRLSLPSSWDYGFWNYYFFTTGLLFFSMVSIYNFDHFLDNLFRISSRPSLVYQHAFVGLLSGIGVLITGISGWGLVDLRFWLLGSGILFLCGVHFLLFHSRIKNTLYPVKEISVALICGLGLVYPVGYWRYARGEDLFTVESLVLLLIILNSAYIYSWAQRDRDQKHQHRSLFHLITVTQGRRFILSLVFFSLIAILLLLQPQLPGKGMLTWYFVLVVLLQGIIVRTSGDLPLARTRLLSEAVFFILLPFFLGDLPIRG